jgi:hypothetical protein
MLQAILEGVSTFGPIVFLMLLPVLIPIVTVTIGTLADRRKQPASVGSKQ